MSIILFTLKISNPKLQFPNKFQNPIFKKRNAKVKKITNQNIDDYYKVAKQNGALGGRLLGAGGGGFLLLYANTNKHKITNVLEKMGLKRVLFRFDFEGAKIITNYQNNL